MMRATLPLVACAGPAVETAKVAPVIHRSLN